MKLFFDLCICVNMVGLSLYGVIEDKVVVGMNDGVTVVLFVELVMKAVSMRMMKMVGSDPLETGIVVAIMVDLVVSGNELTILSTLKAILFYRVIVYYEFAQKMITIAEQTLSSYLNLTFLMFVLILIYALVGMEVFQRKYDTQEDELGMLHSFDDPVRAWVSVFDISTNDDWYGLLILGTTHGSPSVTCLYLFIMIYLINYITFGIVLAILLDGFSIYLNQEKSEQEVANELNRGLIESMPLNQVTLDETPADASNDLKQANVNLVFSSKKFNESESSAVQSPQQK